MHAFIGLGSNVGNGPNQIHAALDCLRSYPDVRVLRVSSLYRTAAWGLPDQPDFTNAVAELATTRAPGALLDALLECEAALGRVRGGERWGPRRIDLDLLCCEDLQYCARDLQIPHPRMHERAFVLVPLLELEPDFEIPGRGAASEWLTRADSQPVERIG